MGIWSLGPFSSDSPSQLDILWHDGHTLGVDGAQVGVLEETNQVSLTGLLEGSDGCRLKPEISFEILSNFSHKTLEGQLADKQFS
jgi:histone H3